MGSEEDSGEQAGQCCELEETSHKFQPGTLPVAWQELVSNPVGGITSGTFFWVCGSEEVRARFSMA